MNYRETAVATVQQARELTEIAIHKADTLLILGFIFGIAWLLLLFYAATTHTVLLPQAIEARNQIMLAAGGFLGLKQAMDGNWRKGA